MVMSNARYFTGTELQILETACRNKNAGAARYLFETYTQRLIDQGYLVIKSEHAATITEKGIEAFCRGYR